MTSQTPLPHGCQIDSILIEREFPVDGFGYEQSGDDEPYRVFAIAVDSVLHRFGVHCEHFSIIISRQRVVVVLELAAGEWHYSNAIGTVRRFGWQSRLRYRILRLLEDNHEELG